MTEQEFFDKLTEISKDSPFCYNTSGVIREKETNYCPIVAVAKKMFSFGEGKTAQALNGDWHLISSLLELEYSFAKKVINAADGFLETNIQETKDKLTTTLNLPKTWGIALDMEREII